MPHLALDNDGFAIVTPDGERHRVRWRDVTRVATYKLDLFAVDSIVLAFETSERPGLVLEVREEYAGFRDLFSPLASELGVDTEWYRTVMLPPFAMNYRVLFERPAASTSA